MHLSLSSFSNKTRWSPDLSRSFPVHPLAPLCFHICFSVVFIRKKHWSWWRRRCSRRRRFIILNFIHMMSLQSKSGSVEDQSIDRRSKKLVRRLINQNRISETQELLHSMVVGIGDIEIQFRIQCNRERTVQLFIDCSATHTSNSCSIRLSGTEKLNTIIAIVSNI